MEHKQQFIFRWKHSPWSKVTTNASEEFDGSSWTNGPTVIHNQDNCSAGGSETSGINWWR